MGPGPVHYIPIFTTLVAAAFAAQGEDAYACAELRRYVELAPNGRYAARARTNINICE